MTRTDPRLGRVSQHGAPLASRLRRTILGLTAGALTCLAIAACSTPDPNATPAVPAAGTIKYKGQPIETGTIQFIPAKGRAANGKIEAGQFSLTTYKDGDGAIPGLHAVAVFATKEVAAKKAGQEASAVSIIPERYSAAGSSGLSVEIPREGKKDIALDLQ